MKVKHRIEPRALREQRERLEASFAEFNQLNQRLIRVHQGIDELTLLKIINHFGRETQINKIQEEALELALALNQIKCPTKDEGEMIDQLYGELADMKIMMAQAELLFDAGRINAIVEMKLKRVQEKYLDEIEEPEQITLKELGEKYLELYDPRLPEESQCTGWHELKRLVLSGVEELKDSDLVAFHPNLREVLRGHWGNIKKSTTTMTSKELAQLLHNREYSEEMTSKEESIAKDSGLVVVFGYSDDNCEFRGAIHEEISCWNGCDIYFSKKGNFTDSDGNGCLTYHKDKDEPESNRIDAVWCEQQEVIHSSGDYYSWTYKTTIPHETFDIMEDGEPYCRGIVFSINDLK